MTLGGGKENRIRRDTTPGAGLKTGDFVQEKLVVATVERLGILFQVPGPLTNADVA